MSVTDIKFLTALYSKQEIEAVIKDGVKVESILTRDFEIGFTWEGKRWIFRVPARYRFAPSIPPIARTLAPATGAAQWASIPHDYGYQHNSLPRKVLDQLYAAILAASNEKGRYRRRQYWAVRLFGWLPWRNHGHDGPPTFKGVRLDD